MSLEEYRRRRDFRRTPEPAGEGTRGAPPSALWDGLPHGHRFCVQMHRATRLHYDLRLEHGGVLLSWAVPRGPSLDPRSRRLAVRTEDHPVDYGDFEGVIPSGYGMGTVELWDAGSFEWVRESAADPDGRLARGDIKFRLRGRKLSGEFALVRLRAGAPDAGERNFLLIKKQDESAVAGHDAAGDDRSVLSGRSLAQIAAQAGGDPRQARRARPPGGEPASQGQGGGPGVRDGALARLDTPAPMLATAADRPFSAEGWIFELKYDGIRVIAAVDGGEVRLRGRRGREETARFPEAAGIPAQLRARSAVLDCEVVVLDAAGRPDFERLQSRINARGAAEVGRRAALAPVTFVAFDLLALDGRDLTGTELRIRKKTLRDVVAPGGPLLYADHVERDGESFFAELRRRGLEGMVAKRAASRYLGGRRSADWVKVKAWLTQSCAIAGWTEGREHPGRLGALELAVRGAAGWSHCGAVGTGIGAAAADDLLARLAPLERPRPHRGAPRSPPTPGRGGACPCARRRGR